MLSSYLHYKRISFSKWSVIKLSTSTFRQLIHFSISRLWRALIAVKTTRARCRISSKQICLYLEFWLKRFYWVEHVHSFSHNKNAINFPKANIASVLLMKKFYVGNRATATHSGAQNMKYLKSFTLSCYKYYEGEQIKIHYLLSNFRAVGIQSGTRLIPNRVN